VRTIASWFLPAVLIFPAMQVVIQYWHPDVNPAITITLGLAGLCAANGISVRLYGEIEFWISILKVASLGILVPRAETTRLSCAPVNSKQTKEIPPRIWLSTHEKETQASRVSLTATRKSGRRIQEASSIVHVTARHWQQSTHLNDTVAKALSGQYTSMPLSRQ
jgi:hypothetical protein